MISGECVICISSIDWDAKWQGHQQIMAALARAGNRVLFVENTGVRAPTVRDLPRLGHRLWKSARRTRDASTPDSLTVHSPLALPLPYSRLAQRINHALLARACRRWAARAGCARPIVWTFLPTPLVLALVRTLGPKLTVYQCIDHFPLSSPGAARIEESENELFRSADVVFVTSEGLRARAARMREQVEVAPFGVDFALFESVRLARSHPPADLERIPHPRVGLLGGLNLKTDLELLESAARRLPDVHFVVIGPQRVAVRRQPNIHVLGQRSHAEVPHYLKGLDAGLIPYRITPFAEHVYPAKLNEYLAMGLPVVSTPIVEVQRFNRAHADIVALASGTEQFCEAIEQAIADQSATRVRQRVAAAHSNRWDLRIAAMSASIESALEKQVGSAARHVGSSPDPLVTANRTRP